MKKALKITGISLAALLLVLILLPIAFKGKIKDVVIQQANSMLNAKLNFDKVGVSFIRNFPNASVSLDGLTIVGVERFEGDTLVSAEQIRATVDLKSLLSSDYNISKVLITNASCNAIVLEDGAVNWDIVKPSQDDQADDSSDDSPFELELKKVTLENVNVSYDDRQGKIYAAAKGVDLQLSGNMSADRTKMAIQSAIAALTVQNGGVAYLKDAKVAADVTLDADLDEMRFELKDNRISLNAINAKIDGWFAMPEDEIYDMDLKLVTDKISFKDILSMIPAIYAKDFQDVTATGNVTLDAWAKGRMEGESLPAFDAKLLVEDATFRYPSLPKGVDGINIAATATNPGGDADQTVVDVQKLTFSFGGNPFAASMKLVTPVSDPDFALTAKGVINLGMVKDVYPIEDANLHGILNADLHLEGRMSYLEKEQYDGFKASGTLGVTDLKLEMKDMKPVDIQKSLLTFTPRYLHLSETAVKIGESDMTVDCKLENYIAYALKDKTIRGSMNLRSNYLNLDELMGDDTESASGADTTSMTVIEVPRNIDLAMTTSIAKLRFSDMDLTNVSGSMTVSGGTVNLKNLTMNGFGGGVAASGLYSTARDPKTPDLDMSFKLNNVLFAQVFESLPTFAKFAPVFKNMQGNFSTSFALKGVLGQDMSPVISSLTGQGGLSTQSVSLSGIKALEMLAEAVKYDKIKTMSAKDLKLDFTVDNGRLATKPFDIKAGDVSLNLSGSTGIDQTIDYTGKVTLPSSMGAIAQVGTIPLKITGTFTTPKVSIDMKSMVSQAASDLVGKALGDAGAKLGIDIADAVKQKEALVKAATEGGAKLIAEAQKQADELVKKASESGGPLAAGAAKIAGDKLVKEAQKKSDAMVAKAIAEGDKLIENVNSGSK